MNEFLDTLAVWLRENVDPRASKAITMAEGYETTGYCHTCADSEAVVWITYQDIAGKMHNIAERIEYVTMIRDLEKIAYREEHREARECLRKDLALAIRELPGRTDMVYEVLAEVLRFPDADGVEKVVHRGAIVDYLPAVSIEWLIKDGLVRPKCLSPDVESCTCEWCRLAALTEEDREYLEMYGWKNPFEAKK